MTDKRKLKLVMCWHMHQPEYRDLQTGEFKLPWTYLHVIKDYVDMIGHLESVPEAKAVVNFAPVLLEQIEDYNNQVTNYLEQGRLLKDPLLAALIAQFNPIHQEERWKLIKDCLRANRERQINRYPAFKKLVDMVEWVEQNYDTLRYINDQFLNDIIVWDWRDC